MKALLAVDSLHGKRFGPPDHPLRQAPNIILTPHLAFYSRESVIELQTKAAEEVARALKGEPPRSPVNPEVFTKGSS